MHVVRHVFSQGPVKHRCEFALEVVVVLILHISLPEHLLRSEDPRIDEGNQPVQIHE